MGWRAWMHRLLRRRQREPVPPPVEVPSPPLPSPASPFAYPWAYALDVGRVRKENQDALMGLEFTLALDRGTLRVALFGIADGMGGHQGGKMASRLALRVAFAEVVRGLLTEGDTVPVLEILERGIGAANEAVWEKALDQESDMGTTLTLALVMPGQVAIAHVGDSRAYLWGPQLGLVRLTQDHSLVARLVEIGQLTPEAAQAHPNRNVLYRSVGQHPEVEADVEVFPTEGATRLLLCSDGLWGEVSEERLEALLAEIPDPWTVVRRLTEEANRAGGEDNISAVLVNLEDAP